MSKSQKNEALILGLSFLITGGILAGSGCLLFNLPFCPAPPPPPPGDNINISSGEEILFSQSLSDTEEAGAEAFSNQNYQLAVEQFEAALDNNKNDPETLIYLNNAQIGDQKAYQIAVAVPVSQISTAALEILRGVAQAQTEINQAGGINGVALKVWIADDQNNPEMAKKVAETLSENPDILGVIGHFASPVTLAAAPVYNQNQLVMISATSTSTQISNAGDFIFRTVPSDRFTADKLTQYFLERLGLSKAAIIYNQQSQYSRSLKDELITAIYGEGGEVVDTFDVSSTDFNPFKYYDSLIDQQAEAIILVPDSDKVEKTLQITRINEANLPILAGDSVYKPDTLNIGEAVEGMVVAVPWHIENNRSSEFVQTANQLWGGDVNWRSAMAYDATQTLISAIALRGGSRIATSPSRDGVAQILSESGFSTPGATGSIRFLRSGDRNQAVELVTIQPGTRSGYGYDFVLLP
ncbi:MAG: ABC transporter substrate-binding protein [Microcoleaceae cyanobacterium]